MINISKTFVRFFIRLLGRVSVPCSYSVPDMLLPVLSESDSNIGTQLANFWCIHAVPDMLLPVLSESDSNIGTQLANF